jgi:ABC-type cobalamin/Fe3+-siderophores transport system ATPase subunit
MTQASPNAVHVRALAKRYGSVVALDGVDLELAAGESLGLVGSNGAGKTTLIRCLLDLTAPERGAIELFGFAAKNPAARRRLAYLPERFVPRTCAARSSCRNARSPASAIARTLRRASPMSSNWSATRSSGRCAACRRA